MECRMTLTEEPKILWLLLAAYPALLTGKPWYVPTSNIWAMLLLTAVFTIASTKSDDSQHLISQGRNESAI